jgi:hypothetical protein
MLLLAEWSTLAAALGGSTIGAAAAMVGAYFTLHGTTLNVRYQEREAGRARLLDAAGEFHDRYHAVYLPIEAWKITELYQTEETREQLEEVGPRLIKAAEQIALLLGPDSDASAAARQVEGLLQQSAARIQTVPIDAEERDAVLDELTESLSQVYYAHEAFLRAVHSQAQPASAT